MPLSEPLNVTAAVPPEQIVRVDGETVKGAGLVLTVTTEDPVIVVFVQPAGAVAITVKVALEVKAAEVKVIALPVPVTVEPLAEAPLKI